MEIGFVGRGRKEFWIEYIGFNLPDDCHIVPGRMVVGAKLR